MSSTLYGPYLTLPATSNGPGANDKAVGTVQTTITGSGTYVTPALVLPAAGYYVWYETIPADDFHNSWKPPTFPQTSETTYVTSTNVGGEGDQSGGFVPATPVAPTTPIAPATPTAPATPIMTSTNLAFTGVSQSTPLVVGFGLILLMVGGAFLLIGRSRKRA
ncbi:LPXTG cell wall anchor domain-containing protein [Nakamurella antarctica]|uniref:LPXTG cell wall anchor domain-containing protein n=1 Tax=Nakamurella antarctica TaxID=1902245 RepID=A0A3G8ZTL5_9ACTN|nr:LAETG motif-containing sortase-dependent surface protein [Nakamurella antarctica]AZI57141.1 LPXTG cell wall anchor domain-containing protein [Nakamurella antarctica]